MERRTLLKALASLPLLGVMPFLHKEAKADADYRMTAMNGPPTIQEWGYDENGTPRGKWAAYTIPNCGKIPEKAIVSEVGICTKCFHKWTKEDGCLNEWCGLPNHLVTSVNVTSYFNLEQVFTQGEVAIYDNLEHDPETTISLEIVRPQEKCRIQYEFASDINSSKVWETPCRKSNDDIGTGRIYYAVTEVLITQGGISCLDNPDFKWDACGRFTIQMDIMGDDDSKDPFTLLMNDMKMTAVSFEALSLEEQELYSAANVRLNNHEH